MSLITLIGKGLDLADEVAKAQKVGKLASKVDKGPKLPLDLKSAPAKTNEEINKIAERIARQQLGEHVRKPNSTQNLAGRSGEENERVKNIPYTLEKTRQLSPLKEVTGNVGDVNQAVIGDTTLADHYLVDANGIPIGAKLEGGPLYGLDNEFFWASNLGGARPLQNKVNKLSELYNTDQIMGHHLSMGPVANNFAMHFADANLKAIANSDIPAESIEAFNNIIREKHPTFPGIENPEESYLAMQKDSYMRKYFNDRMKTPTITQALEMPNGLDIQWAITEPDLRNLELGMSGHSVGRLEPKGELVEGADHGTYSHGIPGEFLGQAPELAPFEIAYPDADMYLRSVYRPKDISSTLQKVAPHQVVTDQYLDQLNNYYKRLKEIRGFKDGGSANLEDEFKLADMVTTEPSEGGLNYRDYPNQYGLRAFKQPDGTYGGEMLPKSTGWLGLQQGEGKEHGNIMSEYSIDDAKGSFPTFVPTLDKHEIELLRHGKLTPSIIHKASAWRDHQESMGQSAFKNPEGFARGGAPRDKNGKSLSYQNGDDSPLYPITHGLAPMLYGAAKGTLAGTLGIPGDINELLKNHVVPHEPTIVQNALHKMPEIFPTSEQISSHLPNATKMLGMDKNAQGSEAYGDFGGQNVVSLMGGPQLLGKAVKATKGLPVGMSIKDVSAPQNHPYIGYINKEGKHELFNEKSAKEADYHHSNLVKDLNEYDKDSTLRFVRNNSENRYSLLGDSAIDPYHPESKKQIAELSKVLQEKGADPNAPFVVEHMALPHEEAPYQGKEIGKLSDWYTAPPKHVEFTSTLHKLIDSHKMESMPGKQWSAWINANAPKSAKKEAEATGLHEWLKDNPKATKADIQLHVEANLPQVKVIEKGAPPKLTQDEQYELNELGSKLADHFYGSGELTEDEMNRVMHLSNIDEKATPSNLRFQASEFEKKAKENQRKGNNFTADTAFKRAEYYNNRADQLELNPIQYGGAKWSSYTEPGGKNYQETMLSIPRKHVPEFEYNVHGYSPKTGFKTREEAQAYADEQNNLPNQLRENLKTVDPSVHDAMERAIQKMENYPHQVLETESPISRSKNPDFIVPRAHIYDDPETDYNRVAHLRTKERPTADNKRALFLEELQSDWAQQGRDRGFRQGLPKLTDAEERRFQEMLNERRDLIQSGDSDSINKFDEEFKSLLAKRDAAASDSSIPSGPYVTDTKDWTALGLKHALKKAVDEGHDYMAWTSGAQQAKRYDLSKQINEIHYSGSNLKAYDHDGNEVISQTGIRSEDLPEYIGKEAAEKLLAQPMQGTLRSLRGQELEVGGEGMKGYYDQIIPQTMNDVLKQIGSSERVKPVNVRMGEAPPYEVTDRKEWPSGQVSLKLDGSDRLFNNAEQADAYLNSLTVDDSVPHMGIEITPELREKVLTEGLPHFKHGGSIKDEFSPKALKDAKHAKLAVINPKDYADYANPIDHWGHNDKRKMHKAKDELKHGGIEKVPELMIHNGKVTDHNGRHRNMLMDKKGFDKTLVRIYGDTNSKTVMSENGKKKLPMPKLEDEFKLANIVGAKSKK